MRPTVLIALAISLASVPWGAPASAATPTGFAAASSAVALTCEQYGSVDLDRDGHPEIESLAQPRSSSRMRFAARGTGAGVVLVLVEERLWRTPSGTMFPDLRPSVARYVADLAREGYHAFTLVTRLYSGPIHQDGQIVLALRGAIQSVYRSVPDLRSVVLVGNYPNAFMVRQFYWERTDGIAINGGKPYGQSWPTVPHVRSIPEPVASPADLVLADLDGPWERLYRRGPERLGGLYAAFPDDPSHQLSSAYEHTSHRFEDFFLVPDGTWEEKAEAGGKVRFRFPGEANAECVPADMHCANPMAQPEISIGRINAFHAAVQPDPAIRGIDGGGLLDSSGKPREVVFAGAGAVPATDKLWIPSEKLERRLLVEYFVRNHAYRSGTGTTGYLPANIGTEWGSSVPEMKEATPGWRSADTAATDLTGGSLTALDWLNWMGRPALARAVKAHANGTGFAYGAPADVEAYASCLGPAHWWWNRRGDRLVPDLRPGAGWIHYGVVRTLYENRTMASTPALYYHTGCEIMMPANYEALPYSDPACGRFQIAESLLMMGNGLALIGRGKVFYDEPREFWKSMGEGAAFGDAWRHYYTVERADGEMAKDGIGRKRAYFWSMIGDPTLKLPATLLVRRSQVR